MNGWVERYRAGHHVQVWTEMTSLGDQVRAPGTFEEAIEVARETMRRARVNVERLIEHLPRNGYEFSAKPELPTFLPPPADVSEQLDRLENRIGSLPLSLRFWFEEVGCVNLVGRHPNWDYDYSDPLVVDAPIDYILSEYDDWESQRGTQWDRGAFTVDLGPDYLHKANVSGGAPYSLAVPNADADGVLLWERHQTTFVNYLRVSFRWGGFPGWDRDSPDWAKAPTPPSLLEELAREMLPI